MEPCVLMVKQQIDTEGPYYKAMVNHKGEMLYCLLRSDLGRKEVLKRLINLKSLGEIYSIDRKARIIEM